MLARSGGLRRLFSEGVIISRNPFTNEVIGEVPFLTKSEATEQIKLARDSQIAYMSLPLEARQTHTMNAIQNLRAKQEEIARLISLYMGKPITESLQEIDQTLLDSEHILKMAPSLLGPRTRQNEPGVFFKEILYPIGLVLAITHWTHPFFSIMSKTIPSLLAGNGVLVKETPVVPVLMKIISEAFKADGIPDMVHNCFVDTTTCDCLMETSPIGFLYFEGTALSAGKINELLSSYSFTDSCFEMEGKDSAYVHLDANVEKAAKQIAKGAFSNGGQSKFSVKRAYIHSSIYEKFLECIVEEAKHFRKYGDPLSPETTMGIQVNENKFEDLNELMMDAAGHSAAILCGGMQPNVPSTTHNQFFAPTVVANVTSSMRLTSDLFLGPILSVCPVRNHEEATSLINDFPFGYTSSIFSEDRTFAIQMAEEVELVNNMDHF